MSLHKITFLIFIFYISIAIFLSYHNRSTSQKVNENAEIHQKNEIIKKINSLEKYKNNTVVNKNLDMILNQVKNNPKVFIISYQLFDNKLKLVINSSLKTYDILYLFNNFYITSLDVIPLEDKFNLNCYHITFSL